MNIQQSHKKKYENEMPQTDEGWWESVLAEEKQYLGGRAPSKAVKQKIGLPENAEAPLLSTSNPVADWNAVKQLYAEDRTIEMKVSGHNRGGLLVESDGLAGFVPFSHLVDLVGKPSEVDRDNCLEVYTGRTLRLKVIECVPEDGRVIFSERAALTKTGKRNELLQTLQLAAEVSGVITNITDFGVFVDLGGVEGLIHLSELSWGRVLHPNQIVRLGDEIKVQVLEIAVDRNRVALSLKRLFPNPWEHADVEFPVDRIAPATVTSVLSYGAFARLDAGVEGLIHASEMPLKDGQNPRDFLLEGQPIQVRVLHVDSAHQRLGLSMRLNNE